MAFIIGYIIIPLDRDRNFGKARCIEKSEIYIILLYLIRQYQNIKSEALDAKVKLFEYCPKNEFNQSYVWAKTNTLGGLDKHFNPINIGDSLGVIGITPAKLRKCPFLPIVCAHKVREGHMCIYDESMIWGGYFLSFHFQFFQFYVSHGDL